MKKQKKNHKNLKVFLIYYLPLFLWLAVIFYFSSLPGNGYRGEYDFWFYFQRKGAHIAEYFILTFLFARVVNFYKIKIVKTLALSLFLSLLYAFSDEIHQIFIFGREGKILDVGIDLIGIGLAILIIWAVKIKKYL